MSVETPGFSENPPQMVLVNLDFFFHYFEFIKKIRFDEWFDCGKKSHKLVKPCSQVGFGRLDFY